ncbi:uncharacterized protein [Battus philenor]|uniref:uncharacterized protein isoform X2 n=1 Tax=Battus philenor TaxID=42288 RepID=UPI0035CF1F96
MLRTSLFVICLFGVSAQALGSSDDKFIKKYAMMKIYESCFGPEVVKQIREEMKEAYAKCSSPPSFEEGPNSPQMPSVLLGKLPPGFSIDPSTQTITKPTDGAIHNQENDLPNIDMKPQKPTPINGVLSFRPLSPNLQQAGIPPYMMNPQFRPFNPAAPYFPTPYSAPGMFYPPGLQYNPYAYPQQFQQAFFQPPYFGAGRMSMGPRQMKSFEPQRDLDIRDRLELISRGPSAGRVRNVTCVMQELGYIDSSLEPNYEQITQRINNLPVSTALKSDIQDGLQFCQKFSQCVPEIKRDMAPLSQELIKPMFFFRCYKHKKLEACIMKDIRERFTSEDELDSESDFRSARSIREESIPDPRFEALDEMAVYFYDYLSGGNGMDYDLYL